MKRLNKSKLVYLLITVALVSLLAVNICPGRHGTAAADSRERVNGVYYWRTVLRLDSAERAFIRDHDIRRMYVRMFDVDLDCHGDELVPVATLEVPDSTCGMLRSYFPQLQLVPVVYITGGAIAECSDIPTLAEKIVNRVANMCSYNGLTNVSEIQLDCDFREPARPKFFKLCREVRRVTDDKGLGWGLSSTIRLYQLGDELPPVDYGVLMMYNTGDFRNVNEDNSILSLNDVRPYLGYIHDCPLPLDVAYPTFSWQLLYCGSYFRGLMYNADVHNDTLFARKSPHHYVALRYHRVGNIVINEGDEVRLENSDYDIIDAVRQQVEIELSDRPHSNIIYHLDSKNLSIYTNEQIDDILDHRR